MSAIIPEDGESGPQEVIRVLIALYEGVDTTDVTGPLEILAAAQHNAADPSSKAFSCITAAEKDTITTSQGLIIRPNISYKDAMQHLPNIDVLIVPGGPVSSFEAVINKNLEPVSMIKAYAELQRKNPSRERTLFSVCTGAFILAHAGVLAGQCATTHPDYYTKFENLCKTVTSRDMGERTDLLEERYVVNNPRFDLGDEDENPYIRSRADAKQRRPSNARKGSNSWRESNTRRESNARRMSLKLGGLRVITSGGITTGLDASLYLVAAMVSHEAANEVARITQYEWHKGVVVKGVDV